MISIRLFFKSAIISGICIFMVLGCSISRKNMITPFVPIDINESIESKGYSQKIDGFVVILDLSISMTETYNSRNKYKKAVDIVSRMNQTIPNLPLIGTLRTIGNYNCALCQTTTNIYGPRPYTQEGFDIALRNIRGANGESPMELAILSARKDFSQVPKGRLALIIVSDFKELQKSSIKAAKTLHEFYGDRLSIFNIMVGKDLEGKNLMQEIARTGKYGFSVSASDIASPKKMADFVKMVFLERSLDTDHDGIFNLHDECPNTPRGIVVDSRGCPKDMDTDGVFDSNDQCPMTPTGIMVDEMGCPYDRDQDNVQDYLDSCLQTPVGAQVDAKGCWIVIPHYLDEICPTAESAINSALLIIQNDPEMCVHVKVSTNVLESQQSNLELGKYWGENLKSFFVSKGISQKRLWVSGAHAQSLSPTTKIELHPVSCEQDRDRDGIPDKTDKCPDTPQGITVDSSGCPQLNEKEVTMSLDIQFDSNKTTIKPDFFYQIQKVAQFMKTYPNTKAKIEAHTDSSGKSAYNLKLSQKRAESVCKYIIEKFGIAPDRLVAIGYGESRPIADNKTLEGRKKNRRATAVIRADE